MAIASDVWDHVVEPVEPGDDGYESVVVQGELGLLPIKASGAIGKGRLLAMLLASGAPTELFGTPVVKALIKSKWKEFGKAHLCQKGAWFLLQASLFYAFQVSYRAANYVLANGLVARVPDESSCAALYHLPILLACSWLH